MSSCPYCKEKEICKKNINRLKTASRKMETCEAPFRTVSRNLDSLANKSSDAYESCNLGAVMSTLRRLDEDMDNAMDRCRTALSRTLRQLQRELSNIEKKDDEYHATESNTSSTSSTS